MGPVSEPAKGPGFWICFSLGLILFHVCVALYRMRAFLLMAFFRIVELAIVTKVSFTFVLLNRNPSDVQGA